MKKRLLLLWVEMSLLRGDAQGRISGFVHHTHPLNDERCQAGFLLDEDEWQIETEKNHGEIVLVGASASPMWRASLALWVPVSLTRQDQTIVTGITHCVNPLCRPCSCQLHFPLNEWGIHTWKPDGTTILHNLVSPPKSTSIQALEAALA